MRSLAVEAPSKIAWGAGLRVTGTLAMVLVGASPPFVAASSDTMRGQVAAGARTYSEAVAPTFADVPLDHPYYDSIEAIYQAGYTAGCSTDPLLYCPEATMNRAESAVFLERGIHSASFVPTPPPSQVFADLPLESWAAVWVNSLWEDGYTAGCGTNPLVYCPWQGHTRAEAAVFYLRMLRGPDYVPSQPSASLFTDVSLDTWYAKWVHEAYNAGLIEPCAQSPERKYCPSDPLTRAVAAYMMAQAKGLMPPPQPSYTCTFGQPSVDTFYGAFQGFGAEWDPFFWNTNNQNRGLTQADWDLITQRIRDLHPGIVRVMMQLYWATSDPNLNTWTWDTPQMRSVFRYLDFLKANDIDVVLTDWGWAIGSLYSSPTDTRYAQGLAAYLKEFIVTRGYTNIKYFVVGNEPDNELEKTYGMDAYVTMYFNVDQALKSAGIRDRVKLTGPDMGGQWDFMKTAIDRMKSILDTYDFHRYASTEETSNIGLPGTWESLWSHLDLWRTEPLNRDPGADTKLVLLTEMGNSGGGTNSHPDIDTYEYALHMADYGTTLLTTRINAGIAWEMHDIYYFDGGQFMQWGMWKYKDQNWALRPWSQSFGLLVKHVPRGSIPAPVNGTPPQTPALGQLRCAAVLRPDGGWSLFLVNRTTTPKSVRVLLPAAPAIAFDKYLFDRSTPTLHPDTLVLPPVGAQAAGSDFVITLPGEAFVALVEPRP